MFAYRAAPAQGTQMIDRTVLLLRLVATFSPSGARLTDLAQEASLPAPTVRRILKRLTQHGLIAQDGSGHRYSLGPFARELGLASSPARDAAEQFRPLLEDFVRETGAVGFLLMRTALDSLCINRIDPPGPALATTLRIGDRLPLGVGVGGMVLLAALPDEDCEAVIAANQAVYRRFVRTTGASFRDHLEAARRDGQVIRRSPVTPGIVGFGMALSERAGPPRFAIAGAVEARTICDAARDDLVRRMREVVLRHTADRIAA